MSDWRPVLLYQTAQRSDATTMSGYYNRNVRVDTPSGPVLVRIPLPQADQMDLHIWNEWDLLRALPPYVSQVPRLLYVSEGPREPHYQIHEFVSGPQLNQLAPRGTPVPPTVISDVLGLFDRLARLPLIALPPLPSGWPEDGNCAAFGCLLSGCTQRVYDDNRGEFGELFHAFGIPDDPLATVVATWPTLMPRPFRLVHTDVHRRNLVMSPRGVVFLDWELALWGDPVYDLAVHINKMTYLDDELRSLLEGWRAMAGPDPSWQADLTAYLRHERVKSAIVHTVRYTKEIVAEHTTEARSEILIRKLTGDLHAAGRVWGQPSTLQASDVKRSISRWAGSRTG